MTQFTTLIISSLSDMRDNLPEMSFGEMMYTVLRKSNLPSKPDDVSTSWLLDLKDEDIYNAIEKAIKAENKQEEEL